MATIRRLWTRDELTRALLRTSPLTLGSSTTELEKFSSLSVKSVPKRSLCSSLFYEQWRLVGGRLARFANERRFSGC